VGWGTKVIKEEFLFGNNVGNIDLADLIIEEYHLLGYDTV
jgi:hypothetical protein